MSLLDIFTKSDKNVKRGTNDLIPGKSKHVRTEGLTPSQDPKYSILDLDGKQPSDSYKNRLPR